MNQRNRARQKKHKRYDLQGPPQNRAHTNPHFIRSCCSILVRGKRHLPRISCTRYCVVPFFVCFAKISRISPEVLKIGTQKYTTKINSHLSDSISSIQTVWRCKNFSLAHPFFPLFCMGVRSPGFEEGYTNSLRCMHAQKRQDILFLAF